MAFYTKEITYFKRPGKENTQKVLDIVRGTVKDTGIKKVVVASSSGETGILFYKALRGTGVEVIPVLLGAGSRWSGSGELEKGKKEMEKLGIKWVQGIQAFSGIERAIHQRWKTAGPVMVISDALRLPGEGFKVAIEVSVMAADAGRVSPQEDIIAVAGTGGGSDTALLLKPGYSNKFFELGVKEILCKPLAEGIKHEAR
jgi:hypothetical protein